MALPSVLAPATARTPSFSLPPLFDPFTFPLSFPTTPSHDWQFVTSNETAAIYRTALTPQDSIHCVVQDGLVLITLADIRRILKARLAAFGREVVNDRNLQQMVTSYLRNVKLGLLHERDNSPLINFLADHDCVPARRDQKIFSWFAVPHDELFLDVLERDLLYERNERLSKTSTKAVSEMARCFGLSDVAKWRLFDLICNASCGASPT
ncbi:hypothetical protein JCM10213_008608 [Rhodosporidiobolus nylandii]